MADDRTTRVAISDRVALSAVSIRAVVASERIRSLAGDLLPEVADYVSTGGLQDRAQPFLRYHRFDGTEVMVEVGYTLAEPLAGTGRIQASGLPGGMVVSLRHRGPFNQLLDTYGTLQLWMEANQIIGADAPWEIYHDASGLFSQQPIDVTVCWPCGPLAP
jgi:effector-binding domain-containing protein